MDNSKLVLVLKTLDKAEMRAFRRFLMSKIFNQRQPVFNLFEYLREELASSKPKLDKETVHKKLFPEKPYLDKPVRDVMSYLFTALEKFLAFEVMHKDRKNELLALCKSYRQRNLLKLFGTTSEKLLTMQEKSANRDIHFHQTNYELAQEQYYALIKKGRAQATNLQEVTQSLDISYFANRLRQSCNMLAHQSVYNTTYDFGMIKEIIKEVERQNLLHIPAINIYYYSYLAQTTEDNYDYFKALQQSLVTNAGLFDIAEMKDMYLLAMNVAIKKLNKGATELIPDMLELYKSGVEQKILLTNNQLSRFTYKNIIALALYLKHFDWVTQFMNQYTRMLAPDFRDVTYQYNLARQHYAKKEYSEALQLLFLQTSSDDVYVNMDTKMLLARIYYEQKDQDALDALVDSFKIFIRRKQIISYHRLSYQNFINCLTKLATLNPYDKPARSALVKDVETLEPLPDKLWFLEQLTD